MRDIKWNGTTWVAVGGYYGAVEEENGGIIAKSADGITWSKVPTAKKLVTGMFTSIAWNGRFWVAIGSGIRTNAYSSEDLITWTPILALDGGYRVVSNSKLWVCAYVYPYSIRYSYDGILWPISASANTLFINGMVSYIAWNGTMWVAVGSYNTSTPRLASSSDGINWIEVVLTGVFTNATRIFVVGWNGEMWVASGNGTIPIAYSYDAITWISATSSSGLSITNPESLTWNGSRWILIDGDPGVNSAFVSTNGINWSLSSASSIISTAFGVSSRSVLQYCGNSIPEPVITETITVIGGVGSEGGNKIIYSYDGLTWLPSTSANLLISTFNGGGILRDIKWNGEIWAALINGASFITSLDGILWEVAGSITEPSATMYSIAWNGEIWVCVGNLYSFYSYNLSGWYPITGLAGIQINKIVSDSSMWLCSSSGGRVLFSNDIESWQDSTSAADILGEGAINDIVWNGRIYVAVGNGNGNMRIMHSPDGNNWTVANTTGVFPGILYALRVVAWNGKMFITGGPEGMFAYSYDAITWVPFTLEVSWPSSLIWNGSMWILTDSGTSTVYISTDGINWTVSSASGFFLNTISVCYSSREKPINLSPSAFTGTLDMENPYYLTTDATVFSTAFITTTITGKIWVMACIKYITTTTNTETVSFYVNITSITTGSETSNITEATIKSNLEINNVTLNYRTRIFPPGTYIISVYGYASAASAANVTHADVFTLGNLS